MKTKLPITFLTIALSLSFVSGLSAQRKVLAVSQVKINESIEVAAQEDDSLNSLRQVAEAIDGQLIDALNGTRKFEMAGRSDLDALSEESALTGGGIPIADSDYLVVPTIDDFQDYIETATFAGIGKTAQKRKIRLGMVAKIYDSSTGKMMESANFQLNNKNVENLLANSTRKSSFSSELLRQIAEEMATQISNRVVNVIYPARVVAVTGPEVTINRGDGTEIATGQTWSVYAMGEELIDFDTGESLGRDEIKVGTVVIERVTPQFSKGKIIENYGIERGAVVRLVQ